MSNKYLQFFLDMISAEKGASTNTIAAYHADLMQFFEITKTQCEKITKKHIITYIQELNFLCYAQKSQARKLSALREFCKFLTQEQILQENPCAYISIPKQEKNLPNFLTLPQIMLLVKTAAAQNNKSLKRIGIMVNLLFATGLRVSELVSLPENAINHNKKLITVMGKGNKERIVPISDKIRIEVRDYANNLRKDFIKKGKTSSWLFPSLSSASGHITRGTFFKKLKELAYMAELNPAIISPHTLRHSFATNLINHDADLRSVQKMLGHENIATTEIYTHILKDKLINIVINKHPLATKNFKDD